MRVIPLKACPVCGGNWFREADYYRFPSDLVGQLRPIPMPLLVCLCGTPLRPEIGGVRGGRAYLELGLLMDSLEHCHGWIKDHHDRDSVLAAAAGQLAKLESFQVMADQMKALERLAGRRIAQKSSSRKSPRGRYWAPPERQPASGGVLTLDRLVIALQGIGLTAREAKKAVKAIFEAITDCLKNGEIVETPLGVFEVVPGPSERTLFRLGRLRKVYTKPKRVAFRPSPELRGLLAGSKSNQSVPTEIHVPKVNIKTIQPNQPTCEKCGSTHFVEGEFKQYQPQYSASPGGDILAISENTVRALVCLCGQPILPPRRSSYVKDYPSFQKSFAAAWQYRESASPEAILHQAEELFASKQQHDVLAERIAKLEKILSEPPPPSRVTV